MRAKVKEIYHRFIKFQPGLRYEYRVTDYKLYVDQFSERSGIEIGGPSRVFEYFGAIPLYPHIKELDGVNFAGHTVWEGNIDQGKTFRYDEKKRVGYQYIGEAADLAFINDEKYEFLISSNCLEHLANPLKAIREWLRVITPGGVLLIVVPHKDKTFDHRRPVTRFAHLMEDFNSDIKEDDMTHLDEILSMHDLDKDLPAGNFEQFSTRCRSNIENRCMHHHVFSATLLSEIFHHLDRQILSYNILNDGNIVILVRKSEIVMPDTEILNQALLNSPFKTDIDDLRSRMLNQ